MLEIKNVYKTFNPGTVNAKTALNGLNLVLEDGDFVTVIGAPFTLLLVYTAAVSHKQSETTSPKSFFSLFAFSPQFNPFA